MLSRGYIVGPVGNLVPEESKELHVAVESVLNSAAPILAKLRRPALLLPGKLQAVVKA